MGEFQFRDLDDLTRQKMLGEIAADVGEDKLFLSSRLNPKGIENYLAFLTTAVANGDESDLERSLTAGNCLNDLDYSRGKPTKMPSNAAKLLAQSEFNRYYIRGICLRAIDSNTESVIIYRARSSSLARPESELKIGKKLNAVELLADLRENIGKEPRVLPEVNSGLTVRL